jgi:hypothetical protein
MNRGQDRIGEDKETGIRLTELEVEKDIIEKRDTLTNENKILKACLSSLKS